MTQAPSIKEALTNIAAISACVAVVDNPTSHVEMLSKINAISVGALKALATLQPDGERREAIARMIEEAMRDTWNDICDDTNCHPIDIEQLGSRALAFNPDHWSRYTGESAADKILASGLVQNEAGWRDISTAPKDGTPFIGAFWTIRWADSHRKGDVVTCWWQPEFEAFISSCREMSLAPGLTFENGETSQLHSPVIEPVTHWRPLDRPIRSARDGGAET